MAPFKVVETTDLVSMSFCETPALQAIAASSMSQPIKSMQPCKHQKFIIYYSGHQKIEHTNIISCRPNMSTKAYPMYS